MDFGANIKKTLGASIADLVQKQGLSSTCFDIRAYFSSEFEHATQGDCVAKEFTQYIAGELACAWQPIEAKGQEVQKAWSVSILLRDIEKAVGKKGASRLFAKAANQFAFMPDVADPLYDHFFLFNTRDPEAANHPLLPKGVYLFVKNEVLPEVLDDKTKAVLEDFDVPRITQAGALRHTPKVSIGQAELTQTIATLTAVAAQQGWGEVTSNKVARTLKELNLPKVLSRAL